jgi:hypothetical protein
MIVVSELENLRGFKTRIGGHSKMKNRQDHARAAVLHEGESDVLINF